MTTPVTPPLRVLSVTSAAWEAAASVGTSARPEAAAAWQELVGTGAATAPGVLDSGWQAAIAEHLDAPIVFRLASHHGELLYSADVAVATHSTSCLLRRFSTRVADDGARVPAGADPRVEFAVTRPGDPWTLVRRVLPPLEILRAAPRQTPAPAVETSTLEPEVAAQLTSNVPADLPASVRDALGAHTSVALLVMVTPAADSTGVGAHHWVTDGESLWSLHIQDGLAAVSRVQAGDLGFQIQWYLLGALDAVTRARGGDR